MSVGTARELRNRISAKWGRTSNAVLTPEHIVLYEVPFMGRPTSPEVADDPRLRSRQRIDVVAVGVWRRTGELVHGFEIKVSRGDLLHELRDLSKSEHAVRAVDRWWLVLGDRSIMRDDDPIPESWGIIVARGRGLSIVRDASPQAGECRGLVTGLVMRALVVPRWARASAHRDGLFAGLRQAERMTGQKLIR